MWILLLNDMRSPKSEILQPVARAETKEALKAFLTKHRVEGGYNDSGEHQIVHTTDFVAQEAGRVVVENVPSHTWGKAYAKGSPLEWYNEPSAFDEDHHFQDAGTLEQRVVSELDRVRQWWDRVILPIPVV